MDEEQRKKRLEASHRWIQRHPERHIEVRQKYRHSEKGKETRRAWIKEYRRRNRDKIKAHDKVYRALKAGKLVKPLYCCVDSSECEGRIEAHHWDHNRPLDVTWLCMKHHRALHAEDVRKALAEKYDRKDCKLKASLPKE
jgi:hypothetical protein